ncbi:hypothetical protein ACFLU1_02245 [Chloroflexota bacterium]
MAAKYKIEEKVAIKPVGEQSLSIRDSILRKSAGLTGKITDYYWISPPSGEVFYLYTVRIGSSNKDIVLYEDEIEHVPGTKPSRRSGKAIPSTSDRG